MKFTIFILIGLCIVGTFTGNNSFCFGRPVITLSTVYPQCLYSATIKHGFEDCIKNCLFSGIIAVTVINNAVHRRFSVQVAIHFSEGSQSCQTGIYTVFVHVVDQIIVPVTGPVSESAEGTGLVGRPPFFTNILGTHGQGLGIDNAVSVSLL